MRMLYLCGSLLVLGALLWPARSVSANPPANDPGRQVFFNDFEEKAGPEWSVRDVDHTPNGHRGFLGQFDTRTVALSLKKLPAHARVTVTFDLFIIRSWDGSRDRDPANVRIGPDLWGLRVAKGPTLAFTSFSQYETYLTGQAYPGTYPGDLYPGRTRAVESNTLGFKFGENAVMERPMDSVYAMSYTFPHSDKDLTLLFWGSVSEGAETESWGLDNVRVAVHAR